MMPSIPQTPLPPLLPLPPTPPPNTTTSNNAGGDTHRMRTERVEANVGGSIGGGNRGCAGNRGRLQRRTNVQRAIVQHPENTCKQDNASKEENIQPETPETMECMRIRMHHLHQLLHDTQSQLSKQVKENSVLRRVLCQHGLQPPPLLPPPPPPTTTTTSPTTNATDTLCMERAEMVATIAEMRAEIVDVRAKLAVAVYAGNVGAPCRLWCGRCGAYVYGPSNDGVGASRGVASVVSGDAEDTKDTNQHAKQSDAASTVTNGGGASGSATPSTATPNWCVPKQTQGASDNDHSTHAEPSRRQVHSDNQQRVQQGVACKGDGQAQGKRHSNAGTPNMVPPHARPPMPLPQHNDAQSMYRLTYTQDAWRHTQQGSEHGVVNGCEEMDGDFVELDMPSRIMRRMRRVDAMNGEGGVGDGGRGSVGHGLENNNAKTDRENRVGGMLSDSPMMAQPASGYVNREHDATRGRVPPAGVLTEEVWEQRKYKLEHDTHNVYNVQDEDILDENGSFMSQILTEDSQLSIGSLFDDAAFLEGMEESAGSGGISEDGGKGNNNVQSDGSKYSRRSYLNDEHFLGEHANLTGNAMREGIYTPIETIKSSEGRVQASQDSMECCASGAGIAGSGGNIVESDKTVHTRSRQGVLSERVVMRLPDVGLVFPGGASESR